MNSITLSIPCPDCRGRGHLHGFLCNFCYGTGKIVLPDEPHFPHERKHVRWLDVFVFLALCGGSALFIIWAARFGIHWVMR